MIDFNQLCIIDNKTRKNLVSTVKYQADVITAKRFS